MELKYKLTDQDYLEFNRHYLMTSEAGQKQLRKQFLMGPIFSVILIGMLMIYKTPIKLLILEAIVLIAVCIIMYVKRFDSVMKKIKKTLDANNKKGRLSYNRSGTFTLGEEAIVEKQDDTKKSGTMKLSDIKVIYETGSAFYVYSTPTYAMLLPKSMCASEKELNKVVAYLKEGTNAHWVEGEF